MMRESEEEKKKANMIKLRILRCVKIKCFFLFYTERGKKHGKEEEKKRERQKQPSYILKQKMFSFYPSTSKAAPGSMKQRERERRKKKKGSRCCWVLVV